MQFKQKLGESRLLDQGRRLARVKPFCFPLAFFVPILRV
jgi:hypothetical protein